MHQSLSRALRKEFLKRKEKTAISFFRDGSHETALTYNEIEKDSNKLANSFLDMGVMKGDRVILVISKSLLFIIAHIALQKIGAYTVPLNPGFKESELSYLVNDAGPKLILAGTDQGTLIKDIQPDINRLIVETQKPYREIGFFRSASDHQPEILIEPEDAGVIIYTSGTTGKPKGSIMSQGNLFHDAITIYGFWEITEKDSLCHALPLYHTHGLSFALHTALMAGSHILLMDQFNPERVVELLANKKGAHDCSIFMGVPAMYSKMIEYMGGRNYDFHHMRLWTCGSAPLQPNDFWRIKEVFGKEPVEREGMTETGMNFSNPIRGKRKPGSIGLPLPGVQVQVVDAETFDKKHIGQVGEIWLKSPGITSEYWHKPEETKEAFRDGWFRTGDLGRVDDEGYYYITDRIKHIIISGGENISPKEVELTIINLDDVVECSVVGITDEKWGEKVVAAVVKRPDSSLGRDEVQAHCKEHLHNWKCPKEILFVDALPRNSMGKVLNEEVQRLFRHNPQA